MPAKPVHRLLPSVAKLLIVLASISGSTVSLASELKPVSRLSDFRDWVGSVAFSPDGKWLAAGSFGTVRVYEVANWSLKESFKVPTGMATALQFLADGEHLAVGSYQRIHVFQLGRKKPTGEWKGHRGQVRALSLSADGQRLASASDDETVRVWNVDSGESLVTIHSEHGPMMGVAFSPDGEQLATAAGDPERVTQAGEVHLWNARTGASIGSFPAHKRAAAAVVFLPDGKHVVSASRDETLNVYATATTEARGFYGGHSRPVNTLWPLNERIVCSGSGGRAVGKNEIHVWTIDEGETLALGEASGPILGIAVSPDHRFVAAGTQDKVVEIWELPELNGKPTTPEPQSQDTEESESRQPAREQPAAGCAPQDDSPAPQPGSLRVGIIGLDTSHVIAFTKVLNDPDAMPDVAGCRVVAAYPQGSPDIESSTSRVPGYVEQITKMNVEIVDSIEALLDKVDVVLLETNDGRPHLEQLLPCLKAGKPVFIDKPIAGSLTDAIAIFRAAKHYQVPVFSSSSLRYSSGAQALRNGSLGKIYGAETYSPCSLEKTHPDLFWYGIHGVETLFTVMGPGCRSVTRVSTPGLDVVVGTWNDGRIGSFRGIRIGKAGYGGTAFGEKGIAAVGSYEGYRPLLVEIVKFFRTGKPPIDERETLEIYAFMEAADESKRQDGKPVELDSVIEAAFEAADARLKQLDVIP